MFFTAVCLSQTNTLEEVIEKATNGNKCYYYQLDLKPLPTNSTLSVGCVTKSEKGPEDGIMEVDLVLILIDNTSHKILAQHAEAQKYTSDAIGLSSVSLDMANYKVTDKQRAFGVRDNYTGSSNPNPCDSGNISLYIIENNHFKLILDKFQTYLYNGETNMKCYFDGEETNSVLIMEKSKTNGYYDIRIKSVKTILKSRAPKNPDDDCIDTPTKQKPTYCTLKFLKGRYQVNGK